MSDAGLQYLKRMGRLWRLKLKDTQVTDVGMAYLKDLPALQSWDSTEPTLRTSG